MDEAELTIDDFLKKLEIRDWALKQVNISANGVQIFVSDVVQYETMQQQMKNMTPQEQRNLILQQQLMMKEVQKEVFCAMSGS